MRLGQREHVAHAHAEEHVALAVLALARAEVALDLAQLVVGLLVVQGGDEGLGRGTVGGGIGSSSAVRPPRGDDARLAMARPASTAKPRGALDPGIDSVIVSSGADARAWGGRARPRSGP